MSAKQIAEQIPEMSIRQKLKILKAIMGCSDIVVTGCYGAEATPNIKDVYIATSDQKYSAIKGNITIVIATDLSTG